MHSHINHVEAFFELAKRKGFKDVVLHPFFDGRDTAPKIGDVYLKRINEMITKYDLGSIGSVSGRYYAMDRDKRWAGLKGRITRSFAGYLWQKHRRWNTLNRAIKRILEMNS